MKKIIQYLAVCLCLFLCLGAIYSGQTGGLLSVLGVQTGEGDQQAFVEYLDQLFREEITANTINLHYTLKNPKQYGIKEYPISLGQISQENSIAAVAILENMQAALAEFDPDQMDEEYAMIHDMLKDEIQTEISAAQLYLYQEPLRPSTGVAGELPVLLAEYTFYGERDIQDYLALLRQLPDYYAQVLELEQKKADAGLFMPEYAAREIIDQCENFVKDKENNYLLDTFVDKVQSLEVDREAYIQQNAAAVTEAVIPAYELLIAGMKEILKGLEGQEWNQQGLYHLPTYSGADPCQWLQSHAYHCW